jgi:hypothetical protein
MQTAGMVFGYAYLLPLPQGPMLIFDKSTIQSLTVDKPVLLDTEPSLLSWCY